MNSSSTAKTILFWISIVFLGVMLWKLVSSNGQSAREDTPSLPRMLETWTLAVFGLMNSA